MVALLSLITVVSWGTWIPLAQAVRGVPQRTRTLYVTVGNVMFAAAALAAAGGHLSWGWRGFWLPVVGGVVWTSGNYSAFRASEAIGLARAAGSWAPLNIIVAFAWGAALFGELDGLSGTRFAVLGGALVLVVAGVLVIVRSQDAGPAGAPSPGARLEAGRQRSRAPASATVVTSTATGPIGPVPVVCAGSATPSLPVSRAAGQHRRGLVWAAAAGVLWGSYFVPAQWAGVSAQVSNFPLAVGMLVGGLALVLPGSEPVRLPARGATANLAAGLLFGIGNLALLGLVSRVGTGVGFTIGQLSLLVNASIGIWLFRMPPPGSRAAKLAVTGILVAGAGGAIIGTLR
ncbi:MAG TPA: GRP family sugar transporter [Streptosporangiaceae bacterium]|nr:GRP family sugar transporter [Streptosporangiaceae bacterium]